MNLLKNATILAATLALSATPALAHGGHAPVDAAAHGPLHLLLILGGGFGAGVIAYLAVRALRAQRSVDPTIQ